jgi:pimeloyl-ACP methyl ester carboxylesterase
MRNGVVRWQGHRVHVTETGEGDPLLLVAGLGCNTQMWAPFIKHFPHRRIIRFDAPGTGESSTPMYPVPVASLSDLAAEVLDSCDAPWADVIGFSYGGAIAQQLAYEHPDRIRRLVLASTTCGMGAAPGSLAALTVLGTPVRYYSPTYFDRTAGASYGGMTERDAPTRQRMMQVRRQHPPSPYGYTMQLLGAIGWSSWPFLSQIPHETLVICGDDDPLIPIQNAEMLARYIPHARLEIVEHGGHLLLWDDADHLGRRISRFVNAAHSRSRTPRHNRNGASHSNGNGASRHNGHGARA